MREGYVERFDGKLILWEENVKDDFGFVFERTIELLASRNWEVGLNPEIEESWPSLSNYHRLCQKDGMAATLQLCGRTVEFTTWPERMNRYRQEPLTHLERLRRTLEIDQLAESLCVEFGYFNKPRKPVCGPGKLTGLQLALYIIQDCCHYREDLGHAPYHGNYNRESADSTLLKHGQVVYYHDRKGRLFRGVGIYNLNNMWYVCHRHSLTNVAAHHLYSRMPHDPKVKQNAKLREDRLRSLVKEASDNWDFLKAHELAEVLRKDGYNGLG